MARLKTVANYNSQYNDTVSDSFLLSKIQYLYTYITDSIIYGTFQKSNYTNRYGVILKVKYLDFNIYEYIKNDSDLQVFCYSLNDEIHYCTKETKIPNIYFKNIWYTNINSFIQSDQELAVIIHNKVKDWVTKVTNENNLPILGLGGASAIYMDLANMANLLVSNNSNIITDADYQGITTKLVDYKNLDLTELITTPCILIINISKSGLNNLNTLMHSIISNINIKYIIYIGCSQKTVNNDLKKLIQQFDVIADYTSSATFLKLFKLKYPSN